MVKGSARATVKVYPSGQVATTIRPQVESKGLKPRVDAVERAAINLAPVKTGKLKRSIRQRARSGDGQFTSTSGGAPIAAFEIVVAVPYAGFVVKGTKAHIIRSKGPWPLRNRETGQVFGRQVRHPGTRPNDFLTRALRQGMQRG